MAEVRFENVTKSFGEVTVIPKLDLVIPDTQFVVLVGPSGCGKSTTLRLIAGLEDISSGDLFIGERKVNDVLPRDRDIAMVFQSYALYPHMSVWENLAFGLTLRKIDKKEIQKRVEEVSQILGLDKLLKRRPKDLSGGQRQRVAMGRAIVRRPSVFLFDEPLSNLDAKLRSEMRREIAKLHRRLGTTIVYVTHDQVEAMTLADCVVAMKDGIVQQMGDPLELYRNPANLFVAGFIGTPQMNFIEGEIQGQRSDTKVVSSGMSISVPSRFHRRETDEVMVGIRPSDLVVHPDPAEDMGTIKATVEVREPMGAEVFLTLDSEVGPLQARVENHHAVDVGDNLVFGVPADKMHLFHKESGESLLLSKDHAPSGEVSILSSDQSTSEGGASEESSEDHDAASATPGKSEATEDDEGGKS